MIAGWKEEILADYQKLLRRHATASPLELAARLGISESSVVFWLSELAKDGKIRLLAVELAEDANPSRQPSKA